MDYADEAEENRIECIDALTRYRGMTPMRPTPCFITKSRNNLDKIIGGDVSFSTMSNDVSVCRSEMTPQRTDMTPNKMTTPNTSMRVDKALSEQQARYGSKIRKSLLRRFSAYTKSLGGKNDAGGQCGGVSVAVQTESDTPKDKKSNDKEQIKKEEKKEEKKKEEKKKKKKKKKEKKGKEEKKDKDRSSTTDSASSHESDIEKLLEKLDLDVPDGPVKSRHSSGDNQHINSFSRDESNFLVSSTLLEDPTMFITADSVPDLSSVKEEGRKNSSSSSKCRSFIRYPIMVNNYFYHFVSCNIHNCLSNWSTI